jgi:nitrate reductase delta subunit
MPTHAQRLAPVLAEFFLHPATPVEDRAPDAAAFLEPFFPGPAGHLRRLAEAMSRMSLAEQQELHARTFDLTPLCTPYLSVHVFGDESFKRAELMAGLAERYARCGHDTRREVPDHLGVVLEFAPRLDDEEWAELGTYCLSRAIPVMRGVLANAGNSHIHLLRAVSELLAADFPSVAKEIPCSTSSSSGRFPTSPSSPSWPAACGGCVQTPSATRPSPPSSSRAAS